MDVPSSYRWKVLAITGLALALRAGALVAINHPEIRHGEVQLKDDEPSYHSIAATLASTGRYSRSPGGQPTAERPPGIILPLAALYRIFWPSPHFAFLYMLVTAGCLVPVVGELARVTCAAPGVATIAMLLTALMPTLIFTSSGIWSDGPALLLTLLMLRLVMLPDDAPTTTRHWFWLGLTASLAYLTRPSVVFVLPLLFVAVARSGTGGVRVRNLVVFALALSLPIVAWGYRNRVILGEFFTGTTVAGHTLWESNNPLTAGLVLPSRQFLGDFDLYAEARQGEYLGAWVPADYIPGSPMASGGSELGAYHEYVGLTVAFVKERPAAWLRLIGFKLRRIVSARLTARSISGNTEGRARVARFGVLVERWVVLGFGLLGLAQLYRTRNPFRHWYASFAGAGLCAVLVTYVNARFLLPTMAVLIVPAALAIALLGRRLAAFTRSGQS